MIYEVDVFKSKDGKLYFSAENMWQVWDYLENAEINDDDVVWDDCSEIEFYPDPEIVHAVKRNDEGNIESFMYGEDDEELCEINFSKKGKKVPIIDLYPPLEESQPMFMNECKNDDGCGGCPYYDNCALTQLGRWLQ